MNNVLNRLPMALKSVFIIIATTAVFAACSSTSKIADVEYTAPEVAPLSEATIPTPDPRVGLAAGLFDAEEAIWNMELVSQTPPPDAFLGKTNSDLAFKGNYAIQGNYNGVIIWDITDPANPVLVKEYVCPASQSDVSVYGNLMFVSGEGREGRLDCGAQGVSTAVSKDRLRGIRIFDISDIENPKYVSNVQTCRGSHTHSVLEDPNDEENIYVYVSGSAGIRPDEELPGCSYGDPDQNPNSAEFRIEVIKVPLADPSMAAIVSSPRIFDNLDAEPRHGNTEAELAEARESGAIIYERDGEEFILSGWRTRFALRYFSNLREEGAMPNSEDSTMFFSDPSKYYNQYLDSREPEPGKGGPTQCHDITLYPEIGLAGGACEGYGLLLDITEPENPRRIDAVADKNFSYWHSATFNNDGTSVLFTDEWGGGGAPKCRETDPYEWGANAIFTLDGSKMNFESYYKLSAAQSSQENCVAHNGSLIPVPGRDIMVQAWYQGGISVFDWTDASNPVEIAFHDRGPVNGERMLMGGSWSVYYYNGTIVSSEIARGLDLFKLTPSPFLTQNEIDAANSVKLEYLNTQGQPKYSWPSTYALANAYVDQLHRDGEMEDESIAMVRQTLANAKANPGSKASKLLSELAETVSGMASTTGNPDKVQMLADTVSDLASN